MKIHFRDVQTGMVEARAVIELEEGVFLNEVTLLNIDGQLVIEFPRKNFIGKNDRKHNLDIITFENEDKQILWELQIKEAYKTWRKENRKVLIYENKPAGESDVEEPRRRTYKERSYDDKPRSDRSYGDRKPRSYSDRDNRAGKSPRPYSDKPAYRDRPDREKRTYDDKPRIERVPRQEKPSYSKSADTQKPKRQYKPRDTKAASTRKPVSPKSRRPRK